MRSLEFTTSLIFSLTNINLNLLTEFGTIQRINEKMKLYVRQITKVKYYISTIKQIKYIHKYATKKSMKRIWGIVLYSSILSLAWCQKDSFGMYLWKGRVHVEKIERRFVHACVSAVLYCSVWVAVRDVSVKSLWYQVILLMQRNVLLFIVFNCWLVIYYRINYRYPGLGILKTK